MTWQTIVEPSQGEKDWLQIRDCFVRAFHHYPLYKYLIPNEKNRPAFLKQYLEAVYEVTVRNGSSVLLCIKLKNDSNESVMIGGVLFVPPSQSTGGWQCERDQDFWDAYDKYNLKTMDEEAFSRLQRYEEWEYENISKPVCASNIPMWNGIFCAIDPKFAGQGCGSISYSECIKLISKPAPLKSSSKKSRGVFKTTLHNIIRKLNRVVTNKVQTDNDNFDLIPTSDPPTLFALSHSRSAVRFHQKNGLQLVSSLPYHLNNSKDIPFEVSVLLLSPPNAYQEKKQDCIFRNTNLNKNAEKIL